MLTFDVKRKINTLRDILVGKVPDPKAQVEQITIALIYKFMDDMDIEGLEFGGARQFFTGEYEKYAWTEIMKPENSGQQRALLYAEGIEKMTTNPNLPQLFRDIFRGAYIPYRDPDTLNMFLKEVSDFSYDNSEDLGNAFEYLLSIMGSQGDAGQFRTPRHIIDMMVEIVDPKKNETILDPACGTAGFLISAYRHILAQNKDEDGKSTLTADDRKRLTENFAGYDISPDMVRLSRVNMYLHHFTKPKISEYDTLTSEEKWDDCYDVIFANPPFMTPKGGIMPHSRYRVKAKRSEVAQLAGLLAAEIGEDVRMAKRAGLLHDIGKAVDHEMEGSHIQLGAELCKKYKESPLVINAVESHHGDVEPESLIACLVQAADTISAARPGARRETLETYSNRLQQLEDITNGYKGVEKSFAIQAGREIRIMVVPEQVSDADMVIMARDISKQIESELEYPGQIKVNVIRESRIVDYAK